MNEALETKLLNWLEAQGYPLEFEVARRFGRAEWNVLHESVFKDPTSEKLRAADLEAWRIVANESGEVFARVTLWVQCKKTDSTPWIVFQSHQVGDVEEGRPNTLCGRGLIAAFAIQELAPVRSSLPTLFPQSAGVFGHSVVQAALGTKKQRRGPNRAFGTVKSALAAATASGRHIDESFLREENATPEFGSAPATILDLPIPVVVIDGRLFSCELGDQGQPVLDEVNYARVLTPEAYRAGAPALVHIIVLRELDEFLARVGEETDLALGCFQPQLESVVGRLRARYESIVKQAAQDMGFSSPPGRVVLHIGGKQL
jgi:hypothetical protein